MIDHTKCPYCNAPTVIQETPEYEDEREGIYFPYEIVITCTGVHKDKHLDAADWHQEEQTPKTLNLKTKNGNRRTERFLD